MIRHKFLILFFALTGFLPIFAQKTYRFPLTITYDMYLNFNKRQQMDARLSCSGEAACYTYQYTRDYSHADEPNPEIDTWTFSVSDTTQYVLWCDKALNECSELVPLAGRTVRLAEPVPVIRWTMEKDTREIEGFRCQKATCRFRGRNYTAWFTTDIPCNWGPWKLHGLPGAILEAYDDTNEVSFYATGVKRGETTVERADESAYRCLTMKEYHEQVEEKLGEMMKRLASRMGEGFKVNVSKAKTQSIELEYDE